ncbi:MAG: hypothetical protein KGZ66_07735 [Selenomonadales bacterium]|nr:hypothetical protein [Selenomonadales bacterium]
MQEQHLSHRLVLFLCCALIGLTQPQGIWHIVPMLISATTVGLLVFYSDTRAQFLVAGLFFVGCVLYLPLCSYIPAVIYEVYTKERRLLPLVALVPFAAAAPLGYSFLQNVGMVSALATILKHRTLSFASLRAHYLSLLDTTRAMAAEIKQQNKLVLERQDDAVRIARLSERNRIAREIHDHVGHRLASAVLQIGAMLTLQPEQKSLETLKVTLASAMDDIRTSVHDLHESSIDFLDHLEQAAAGLSCCQVQRSIYLQSEPRLEIKYAFIAVVKEAFANVSKHSDATVVRLALTEHTTFYQLIVADNGSRPSADYSKGMGLRSIAARIESLNGQFLVRTTQGFEIFITVPKEGNREASRS